jgi:surface antigen
MKRCLATGVGTALLCLTWVLMASAGAHVPGHRSGRGPTALTAFQTPAPSFSARAYRVRTGQYVTVLVHTHQQVNSPAQACRLTVSGPGAGARSFVHADITGDFELTFAARGARPGAWRLTESCQARRGARSRVARVTVRVVGGHGSGALGGRVGPFFNAQQPPLSAGNGGAGTPPNPFQPGQCTYYAYLRRPDIYLQSVNGHADPQNIWDAHEWAYNAAHYGHFKEGTTPEVGALMVEPGNPRNPDGHVAYVSAVTDASHFATMEMNTRGLTKANGYEDMTVYTVYDDTAPNTDPGGNPSGDYYVNGQIHRHVAAGTVFIYGGQAVNPSQYAGEMNHIVQWSGDTKAQKTAWLVVDEGGQLQRHWIPTIAIYWCLKNSGDAGPDVLPAAELNALPDDTGVWATCTGNSAPPGSNPGAGSGGAPPAPTTYAETEGHNGVNTFTDPTTASGLGQRIAPAQQVQVSCKVYAPQIASVNPDGYWYLIASAPRSGAYYAPANTFMNGDPWNGPYTHNTDFNVPDCGGSSSPPTTTTTTTTTTTPPPAQTWAETVGGVTHTWSDYTNAGGTQGPSVQTGQTVQVACAVPGFQVADGDTWWYRIASSPWSSAYYASADAFYNNGQTTGSLLGTPFLDPAVAHC